MCLDKISEVACPCRCRYDHVAVSLVTLTTTAGLTMVTRVLQSLCPSNDPAAICEVRALNGCAKEPTASLPQVSKTCRSCRTDPSHAKKGGGRNMQQGPAFGSQGRGHSTARPAQGGSGFTSRPCVASMACQSRLPELLQKFVRMPPERARLGRRLSFCLALAAMLKRSVAPKYCQRERHAQEKPYDEILKPWSR